MKTIKYDGNNLFEILSEIAKANKIQQYELLSNHTIIVKPTGRVEIYVDNNWFVFRLGDELFFEEYTAPSMRMAFTIDEELKEVVERLFKND